MIKVVSKNIFSTTTAYGSDTRAPWIFYSESSELGENGEWWASYRIYINRETQQTIVHLLSSNTCLLIDDTFELGIGLLNIFRSFRKEDVPTL
jgi:hypothetical protein